MGLWEYRKIALNQLSAKTADVDLLNDAGEEGWSWWRSFQTISRT